MTNNNSMRAALHKVAAKIEIEPDQPPADVCPECNDTGLRRAQVGEHVTTPGPIIDGVSKPITFMVTQAPDGSAYPDVSIECTACLPKRNAKQKVRYQTLSGLTEEEKNITIDSIILSDRRPSTRAMVTAGKEVLTGDCSMLTIYGGNGNAKTMLLMALVNAALDAGTPALYITAFDMLQFIQQAFEKDGSHKDGNGSALDRIEMLKGVRFLAIDELQAIKETEWNQSVIDNLIDRRYRDAIAGDSVTLLAMNEHPEGLSARVYSRLRDARLRKVGSPIVENTDVDIRSKIKRT